MHRPCDRPDPDDKAPEQARIDLDIDGDDLAADRLERARSACDVFVLELLGDGDLGRRLALVLAPPARGSPGSCRAPRTGGGSTVTSLRNFAARPPIPARSSTADSACNCSSAENTGLRTKPVEVGIFGDERVEALEVGLDRVDRIRLARQIEQRGRVAAGHAGYDGFFACQVLCSQLACSLRVGSGSF